MNRNILTDKERESLIQWCTLFSGYHASYYEKFDDEKLNAEYEKLTTHNK